MLALWFSFPITWSRLLRFLLLTFALAFVVCLPIRGGAEEKSPIGRKIESVKLQDFRGAAIDLGQWQDRDLIVVAFVGTECPLAKLYGPRLAELAGQYEPKKVGFVAIDSNAKDTLAEMGQFARASTI